MISERPIVRPWEWVAVLPPETVAEFQQRIVQLVRGTFDDRGRFVRDADGPAHVIEITGSGHLASSPAIPNASVEYRRWVSQWMYFRGEGEFRPTFAEVLSQITLADLGDITAFEIESVKIDRHSLAAGFWQARVTLYRS